MGAGSLGSLLGGLLAPHHDVTLVGREPHMRAVAMEGLRITGLIERTVSPAATTDWSGSVDPDVAIVAVKTYDTDTAAAAMREHPAPVTISVQNGLGSCRALEAALGSRSTILAGTVTYGALLDGPGCVRCTGRGEIVIGDPSGGRHPAAERIAAAFQGGELQCRATDDMPRHRWEKLAVNAAINPITALARVRNGAIRDEPLRSIAASAAREVVAIASERGHAVDEAGTLETVFEVAARTADNESSMARDVRRGRPTEIDAITGAVIERSNTTLPVNQVLYALMCGYERGAGLRDPV